MVADNVASSPHYQGKFRLFRGKLWAEGDPHWGTSSLVADGCIFENDKVAVCWLSEHSSIAVWDSFDDFLAVSFANPPQGRWAGITFQDMHVQELYKETP